MSRRDEAVGEVEASGKARDIVVLRNVDKRYPMGSREVYALRDVSLTLAEGTMAVVQGTSGSGKTTLLNIIGAMDRPTGGTVKVAGQDLTTLSEEARTSFRHENVGFVFQFFNLIPTLNAMENVLVPVMFQRDQPVDRAQDLLERVGLSDRWDHRPGQLSGGERQRLSVARALIKDPPLVLADEPTGNLDHETGQGVLALLRGLADEGRTVVVVTHDPEVAAVGDTMFDLRDGALVGKAR